MSATADSLHCGTHLRSQSVHTLRPPKRPSIRVQAVMSLQCTAVRFGVLYLLPDAMSGWSWQQVISYCSFRMSDLRSCQSVQGMPSRALYMDGTINGANVVKRTYLSHRRMNGESLASERMSLCSSKERRLLTHVEAIQLLVVV